MTEQLDDVLRDSERLLLEAEAAVFAALRSALEEIESAADDLDVRIAGALAQRIVDATAAVSQLTLKLRDNLNAVLRLAQNILVPVDDRVVTALQAELNQANETITVLQRQLSDSLRRKVEDAETTEQGFLDRVQSALGGGIDSVLTVLGEFDATTKTAVAGVLDRIDRELTPRIQRIQEAIPNILSELGQLLAGPDSFFTNPIESLGKGLSTGITELFQGFLRSNFDLGAEQIDPFVRQLEESEELGEIIKQFTGGGAIAAGFPGVAFLVVLAGALALAGVTSTLAGAIQKGIQASNRTVRPTLMSVPELREVLTRDGEQLATVNNQLRDAGFSEDKIALITSLRFNLLGAAESLDLWRRGEIGDGELTINLNKIGWGQANQEQLKTLAFAVPGIGDIIRMAVREVFSPEISEPFGQFEEVPPAYFENARKAGLSEEWALNFWAAHWTLPSPQQGFEMLHRKVISPADLERLLKALDVMPFWRQPLVDIAFNPLTRVDLRRMHRLGLLDEADLQLRYEDLGFNPDNAALMVKFTIAFNAPPDKDKEKEPNDFTRTQIVQFFRRGLFTEAEAVDGLAAIGWSREGAQTIIDNEIIAQDDRARTRAVRLIERRFVKGFINRADVFEELDALEITEIERTELVSEMEAKREEAIDVPSRAELDRFFREKIIDQAEYIKGLEDNGIPAIWRERFALLIEREKAGDE